MSMSVRKAKFFRERTRENEKKNTGFLGLRKTALKENRVIGGLF